MALGIKAGAAGGYIVGINKAGDIAHKSTSMANKMVTEYGEMAGKVADRLQEIKIHEPHKLRAAEEYAKNEMHRRREILGKALNRLNKKASRMTDKAMTKSIAKGALIGTAVAAPIAYGVNKAVKKNK